MFLKYVNKDKIKEFIKENICRCVGEPFESVKKSGSIELIFNCGINDNGEYREVHCFDEKIFFVNFNYSDHKYKDLNDLYHDTIMVNLPSNLTKKYIKYLDDKKIENEL